MSVEGAGGLERQLRLVRLLAARRLGMTVEELASEASVSVKTIRRDLDRLVAVGFPVAPEVESHGRKRWRLDSETIIGAGLAYDEAFALMLAAGALKSLDGTEIGEALEGAIEKLRCGLSEQTLKFCDRLVQSITLVRRATADYRNHAEALEAILAGHQERKNVFITYHSRRSTEPTTYPISPYAIRFYRDAVYVIAYSEEHDEVRTFKLDRISEAGMTEIPFQIPREFDADDYLASAMGIFHGEETVQVKIRYSRRAARPLSETHWHPSQTLEPQADGSVIASYDVALTPELVGWILSIGRDATVIHPPELITRVREEAEAILRRCQPPRMLDVTAEDDSSLMAE